MSKSRQNVIDPQKILKLYGGEAIRFWAATEGDLSKQDLKCSEERTRGEVKTINKLINVSKFILLFEKPKAKPKLENLDKLFLNYINYLSDFTEKNYEVYNFYNPSLELRKFLWEIFASHYIELVKTRAYNPENKFSKEQSNSAKWTLYEILERFLILSYPIIPQVSSLIGKEIGIDLLKTNWPKIKKEKFNLELINSLIEFNSKIWKQKKESSLSLKDEIKGIKIPKELKPFECDLIVCHNIK